MFTILLNSTTADANVVNANFYHIAQGSRIPMGGVSLAATNLAYNLGSSSAYWQNLFINNINANSITTANKSLWFLISKFDLTATASSISITGLNGDNNIEYKIIALFTFDTISAQGAININNRKNCYGWQCVSAMGTSVGASRQTLYYDLRLTPFGYSKIFFTQIDIYAKYYPSTPTKLLIDTISFGNTSASTYIESINSQGGVFYNGTGETVTSIQFLDGGTLPGYNLIPNCHIEIWGRR